MTTKTDYAQVTPATQEQPPPSSPSGMLSRRELIDQLIAIGAGALATAMGAGAVIPLPPPATAATGPADRT